MSKELRFSQKYGFKKVEDVLQVKSMNKNLKTGLWNIFLKIYLNRIFNFDCDLFPDCFTGEAFSSFYNKPLDEVPSDFII
ncbi:hypothetical protein ATZ36_12100 [Candidatus Endomicrobiellum trichonymphae]|jgi:hypothetical protein|uniref:HEPN AbiJ-N-terminal domain-containing protein n=1 Tax=Endomicrobium trichonymphae TaxID=1408204 RepID=A0A1E5IN53_ENDTX|nr:hypothetical protein ATZ36_12100 [Candidatus Endomicrobium trichonymphae]